MDFKQIEAFVNVVKYKGFSKAAAATFLTQPTISSHINALENELNLHLIDRNRKESLLTSEGRVFYNYALSMLNMRSHAIFAVQNYALNINGVVEIQTSSVPGEYIVLDIIAAFKREYPDVRFELEQSDSSRVMENILNHKGEIGFTGVKMNNGLVYHPIMRDRAVLITPDNDKFRDMKGKAISLKTLVGEPFVLREWGSGTRDSFEKELTDKGISLADIDVVARMNNMEAIKHAVKNGMGISIISEVAADADRQDKGYLVFELEDYSSEREFYLVYSDRITMSPTAETFKLFIMEMFA